MLIYNLYAKQLTQQTKFLSRIAAVIINSTATNEKKFSHSYILVLIKQFGSSINQYVIIKSEYLKLAIIVRKIGVRITKIIKLIKSIDFGKFRKLLVQFERIIRGTRRVIYNLLFNYLDLNQNCIHIKQKKKKV